MQGAMGELRVTWRVESIKDEVKLRIGIHHVPVVVGNFGDARRSDFTAIGPTVNLASRIDAACTPGDVFASGEVCDYCPRGARSRSERSHEGISGTVICSRLADAVKVGRSLTSYGAYYTYVQLTQEAAIPVKLSPDQINCIYCKKPKPRPAKGEHVVVDGLDGTACIPDVCVECNGACLGPLDREFLRNSIVAFHRLFTPGGKQGRLTEPQFAPSPRGAGWLDAVITTWPITLEHPPQVFFVDDELVGIFPGRDHDALVREIKRLAEMGLAGVRRVINPRPEHEPARLVIKRVRKRFSSILRARSVEDADAFARVFAEQAPTWADQVQWSDLTPDNPRVVVKTIEDVNVVGRCAAKMAFNFLADYLGPELALQDEFDGVRDYILGTNVEVPRQVRTATGELGLTVDERYVRLWANVPDLEHWSVLPGGHTIMLSALDGDAISMVHLYEGRLRVPVRLGRLPPDAPLRRSLPAFFFTPIGGGGDQTLTLPELLTRRGIIGRRTVSSPRLGPTPKTG
jgi:hypothetical protein